MLRNTNFSEVFPMFLSFISICQYRNIHPSQNILVSPSLCNSLCYRSNTFSFYYQKHCFYQASSPGFLYRMIFCTPYLQKNLGISIYLTGFKGLGIFAPPVFSGGQKPPEIREFRKINVNYIYCFHMRIIRLAGKGYRRSPLQKSPAFGAPL